MTELKSAEQELSDCKAAWSASPKAKFAWTCHHQILIEPLTEPYQNRIDYILSDKDNSEHAVRFRNFRPVRITLLPELDKAYAEWNKELTDLHKQDWPDHTWNGKDIGV